MTPNHRGIVNFHIPVWGDGSTVTPYLQAKSGRADKIEGLGVVIGVLSQMHHDGQLLCTNSVVDDAHVVNACGL